MLADTFYLCDHRTEEDLDEKIFVAEPDSNSNVCVDGNFYSYYTMDSKQKYLSGCLKKFNSCFGVNALIEYLN